MLRITQITVAADYNLICTFYCGTIKRLDVLHIIENQKHLNGFENLLKEDVFKTAKIGQFGEIVWEKIVNTEHNGLIFC